MCFWEKALFESGIRVEDINECMRWAFGEGWESRNIYGSHLLWNELHPDLFKLNDTDVLVDSLKRIAAEYKKVCVVC